MRKEIKKNGRKTNEPLIHAIKELKTRIARKSLKLKRKRCGEILDDSPEDIMRYQ